MLDKEISYTRFVAEFAALINWLIDRNLNFDKPISFERDLYTVYQSDLHIWNKALTEDCVTRNSIYIGTKTMLDFKNFSALFKKVNESYIASQNSAPLALQYHGRKIDVAQYL